MIVFLIVLIIIVAFLLVLIILAQNPKGGLSSQFGGSGTSNLIGVKKTTDLLETVTWSLIVVLFVLSMSTNFVQTDVNQQFTSPNVERAQEQITIPTLDLDTQEGATTDDAETTSDDSNLEDLTDQE
jgi:preprotein translocase subunit SecG